MNVLLDKNAKKSAKSLLDALKLANAIENGLPTDLQILENIG
jgi:hypothetical protein